MLPSVFIAAALVGRWAAVLNPSIVPPTTGVAERLRELAGLHHPVLRPLPPEYLKLLPRPSDFPLVEPAPNSPIISPAVPTQPDSIQERINALEWGIAALRLNRGSASSIELLQKELDVAKRNAKMMK